MMLPPGTLLVLRHLSPLTQDFQKRQLFLMAVFLWKSQIFLAVICVFGPPVYLAVTDKVFP